MFLVRPPQIIQSAMPSLIWRIANTNNTLFLTFDDGPIPEVTPFVLSCLRKYKAKATFFCVADNVRKNHEVYNMVLNDGHLIGNHTYSHKNGFKTKTTDYLNDVSKAEDYVDSQYFRPPHGRIRYSAKRKLQKKYNIVMWDVLSGDYNRNFSPEKVYNNVISKTKSGSIIVFHDSLKAQTNLRYALPKVLEYFSNKGYKFEALP